MKIKWFKMNEIFAFWFAYILTRPLGASFADWMDFGHDGGLGLGTGSVSLVSTMIIKQSDWTGVDYGRIREVWKHLP